MIVSHHKVVYITYNIQTPDGEILEASNIPVGYIQGSSKDKGGGAKIEAALLGHGIGEQIHVAMSANEVFGDYDESLVFVDNIHNVPAEYHYVGAEVEFHNESGDSKKFTITKVTDTEITIDGNLPFAGKDVIFDITILDIREATVQEIQLGEPANNLSTTLH